MPPAPIMVVVDVEAGTVSGTSPLLDGIVRYEIWEADGSRDARRTTVRS
ncbi:MAG: hypothetical protein K2H99_02390 [Paramuribaculum sp.]|nr:hypothetical protein [Paramuribaculum sp.]MDE5921276.1 hypothetical protein [Paramuribaculum sp.]